MPAMSSSSFTQPSSSPLPLLDKERWVFFKQALDAFIKPEDGNRTCRSESVQEDLGMLRPFTRGTNNSSDESSSLSKAWKREYFKEQNIQQYTVESLFHI